MPMQYNSLKELRIKKELLKKDVKDLEDLITFSNPKESLSAITNGFTDQYLTDAPQEDGSHALALNTGNIIKEVSTKIKDNVTKNSVVNFASSDSGAAMVENALKIGLVTYMGKMAKKNMNSSSWKKKAIGLALIYVAPIALKFVREKLEQYQKNQATSSLEKLI
ncbi:MAG: phosphoribosyl-ATP pyrophosphatase [Bergeyella sp.]